MLQQIRIRGKNEASIKVCLYTNINNKKNIIPKSFTLEFNKCDPNNIVWIHYTLNYFLDSNKNVSTTIENFSLTTKNSNFYHILLPIAKEHVLEKKWAAELSEIENSLDTIQKEFISTLLPKRARPQQKSNRHQLTHILTRSTPDIPTEEGSLSGQANFSLEKKPSLASFFLSPESNQPSTSSFSSRKKLSSAPSSPRRDNNPRTLSLEVSTALSKK